MKSIKTFCNKHAKFLTIFFITASILMIVAACLIYFFSTPPYSVTTYSMGSYIHQTLFGSKKEQTAQDVAKNITELENLISWKIEDSDIFNLNKNAGDDFIEINDITYDILELANNVSDESDGAFDLTIAPISRLWNFDSTPSLPDVDTIEDFLPNVNYGFLSLLENGTAALQKKGTALDLGAIGKGAACDVAYETYKNSDISRAIIAVGGSVGVYGRKPFEEPWKIELKNPYEANVIGTISIFDGFISTSGSYEKTFEKDSITYHHILDPKTGYPAHSDLVSVTVHSNSGALSDALSTACFVLGYDKSLKILQTFDAQAIFITQDNKIFTTPEITDNFHLTSSDFTHVH